MSQIHDLRGETWKRLASADFFSERVWYKTWDEIRRPIINSIDIEVKRQIEWEVSNWSPQ